MHELVVKGGRIISSDLYFEGDIGIDAERITRIGRDLEGETVIDASGKYVLPGVIDSHVHFREPGLSSEEDWVSGSFAAAAGGVTTVLEMPNTHPPTVSKELLDEKRKNFASQSIIDYGFHFGASTGNTEELRMIDDIASVKFYLGSTTGSLLVESNAVLYEQLQVLAARGIIATVHAESEELIRESTERLRGFRSDAAAHSDARPAEAAINGARKAVAFAKIAGNKLHLCHVSTEGEVDIISRARNRQPLTAEVTPHHLVLSREDYDRLGTLVKTNPPLRSPSDRAALWRALKRGAIDIIASDHAPHAREEKEKDVWSAPSGMPGVEMMLPLMLNEVHSGRITLDLLTRLLSENPARIYRISNKGLLKEGFDADMVIVDMQAERVVDVDMLYTKCGWSPYEGRVLKGWPVATIVRGNVVYEDGDIIKTKGREVSYEKFARQVC